MTRMIIAGLLFIASGAMFFFYTQPAYDTLQVSQSQGGEYDQALSKAAELQQIKQSLLSRYNAFNPSDLGRLQQMIPDQVDNIRLILDLDNMAEHYGMALQNVVVNPSQSAASGAVGAAATGGAKYDSLTLSFSTHGTYGQFKQFLSDLESSLRIVDLVTLSIQPDGGAARGSEPSFSYSMTIRTYWLR